jgi:hypothetical protein
MKILVLVLTFLSGAIAGYAQNEDSTAKEHREKHSKKKEDVILPWFVERFKLSAGAFYVVNNTNIQVSLANTTGTNIDFEKDLGINREITTFLANFQWQISRRSRITLNYFKVNRSSDHVLQKDIVFDGDTYYANSQVSSYFNTKIYQFSYGYAILSKPNYQAGLSIGTHIVNSEAGISQDGTTGIPVKGSFGFTAPLPDLGIWGGFEISKRMAVFADISYFALTLNNKSGRLLAFNLNFIYKIYKQPAISLGYTGLDFKVDVVNKNATGNFKWGYNGPALAVNFSFGKKSWSH